ncbi:probable cytochrome P450 28d1 [Musca vetustissima]|uniref:probable cytochrome P450 28d1 n=1 Tax=Musca vetustissima TaxID=27455 RepID=UPI002AB6A1F5|nr:probable cytochrome P450 28d1 [Musca vetustissima]
MFYFLLITLLIFGSLIYFYLTWNFDYWQKRSVNGPKPYPLLGSYPHLLLRRQHFGDDLHDIYKCYKMTDNYVGTFLLRTPTLLVIDPQIVHEIFVTAFRHFDDNDVGKLIDTAKDPLISKNPFILTGDEWQLQRSLITPAMTSSRLKQSYHDMSDICQQMATFIGQKGFQEINGKELALRFTAESLSSCVLGIKANSFTDHPLPISENVNKFASENVAFTIFTLLTGLMPIILRIYKMKFFPKDCERFFINLMGRAYKLRKAETNAATNILEYLMKIQELQKLKDVDLYSHTMTFLIDGLDTTATVISHCLLMLALEPKCQDILFQEVCRSADNNGEITFAKLNEMPYLEACIHESLRIYPPGLWSTKCCTRPYQFRNKDGSILCLEKGDSLIIPIYALHHDNEYYDEPHKFKPERFLNENGGCDVKHYRDHGVFLGFGDGPRTCLGMRFALVQCKAAISSLVKTFHIKLNAKTRKEFKLDPKNFLALHAGGVWLDFERRA